VYLHPGDVRQGESPSGMAQLRTRETLGLPIYTPRESAPDTTQAISGKGTGLHTLCACPLTQVLIEEDIVTRRPTRPIEIT